MGVLLLDNDLETLKGAKRVAILGGTFDPIHNGHISVAKEILKKTDVEKVLFVPNGMPPHKDLEDVTSAEIRLEMARAAVENEENMYVSSIEVERKGYAYTVDTISQIKEIIGADVNLRFVMGADAFLYITSWKDYKRLLEICSFIAVTRPGYNKKELQSEINSMEAMVDCDVEIIEINPVDVSSSEIRELVRDSKSISSLVPKEVANCIQINNLYKSKIGNWGKTC